MGISGQMAMYAGFEFFRPRVAWRLAAAFRSAAPAVSNRVASAFQYAPSRYAPSPASAALVSAATGKHELTRTEAAALTDAGLMPLADYLEMAARRGWSESHA